MKTTHVIGIVLVIILGIFLWEYPFPKQIDKDIPAMLTIEPSQEQTGSGAYTRRPTVIHIKGEAYRKLLREPEYNLHITVDGFGWMDRDKSAMAGPSIMVKSGGISMASLWYMELKSNGVMGDRTRNAMIWFDDDFERIQFWTTDDSPDETAAARNLFVTGKAENAEEAVERLREIREAFEGEKQGAEYGGVYGPQDSP